MALSDDLEVVRGALAHDYDEAWRAFDRISARVAELEQRLKEADEEDDRLQSRCAKWERDWGEEYSRRVAAERRAAELEAESKARLALADNLKARADKLDADNREARKEEAAAKVQAVHWRERALGQERRAVAMEAEVLRLTRCRETDANECLRLSDALNDEHDKLLEAETALAESERKRKALVASYIKRAMTAGVPVVRATWDDE